MNESGFTLEATYRLEGIERAIGLYPRQQLRLVLGDERERGYS